MVVVVVIVVVVVVVVVVIVVVVVVCNSSSNSISSSSIYLLLAECEVRTASYGPSFFLLFMAQARSARAMKTRKETTRIHNLPYGPKKTRLIRCLLYGFVDYSGFEKVMES